MSTREQDDAEWPQSDQAVLDQANIQPDSWGSHGPNQTVQRYQVLANRNDRIWQHRPPGAAGRRINWPK